MNKLIFFGTPDFAIPILQKIINSKFKIQAVYTQPAQKSKRGLKILKSPIHILAEKNNLNIRTPKILQDDEEYLKKLDFDLAVVVAYGQIVPNNFLTFCSKGFVNVHASILPKYRGAAPIQRCILNSDKVTGISIMKLSEKLDCGPVCNVYKIDINYNENSLSLSKRLSELAASKIIENINLIIQNKINFEKQENSKASYAKKILNSETKIDWTKTSNQVQSKVNGLYPRAWFEFEKERYKILECYKINLQGKPGCILDEKLTIACGTDSIRVKKIQRQGKKVQDFKQFLLGSKFKKGFIID